MLTRATAQILHSTLKNAIEEIRAAYDSAHIANMRIDIEISGRVTGDLMLVYKISDGSYNTAGSTKSHNAVAALEEFLRRRGWDSKNTVALLSYAGEEHVNKPETNDIPF